MESDRKSVGTTLVACPESTTCEKMALRLPPVQQWCVCTNGKQVEIEGPSFHAVADTIMLSGQYFAQWERSGYDYVHAGNPGTVGGPGHPVIILDGHVRLCSHGHEGSGAETHLTTQHLLLGIQGAHIEVRVGWTAEMMPGTD
jgi:hypothetical protein